MSRATQKGTDFERWVVEWFQAAFNTRDIERRARNGAKDRGDISGLHAPLGGRIVVEAKNHRKLNLAGWINEAETERGNDDAHIGVVIHKRTGKGQARMGDQYVTLTLRDFTLLIGGCPQEPDCDCPLDHSLDNYGDD